MKPLYSVLALLTLSTLLPTTLGFQCYGCARGIKTPNNCDDFDKADEAEKKSNFTTSCAIGCVYLKLNIDNEQAKISTESLECYVPDARMMKISKMNECKDTVDGKSTYKVCACNTGDYCVQGGSSPVGLGYVGWKMMFGLSLAALTLSRWIQ